MEERGGGAGRTVRFGIYEADLKTGELRRKGTPVPLQGQPFEVLRVLLERPGDLVTRDELRETVWPGTVFVDFERGLNKAVHKLRTALGDSAESPRFIETLARRGYRFIAPVDGAWRRARPGTFRVIWEGRGIPLAEGENLIGRDPESAVWVDATSVSRRHARILVSSGAVRLEDLGSKNGTFLNGQKITHPEALADGDEIRVGSARLLFRGSFGGSTQTDSRR